MKRIKKALIGLAVGTVAALGVVGFAACGDGGLTGEYHYPNAWSETSPDYGIKVKVTLSDDETTIKSVKIVDSDYVEVTDSWEDKDIWNDGIADLLKAYEGKKVADILAVKVETEDSVPSSVGDEDLLITGATQGSGRLLLAVQDALKDLK